MKRLLPLFPFVAALSLLACQGDDGPVAKGATVPPDAVLGDRGATGLAAPTNAGAAEAVDRAATPPGDDGMRWTNQAGIVSFGPAGARPQLAFACVDGDGGRTLRIARLHPANDGLTATLSFTGGGHASSVPMRAVAKPGGPGESEWQGNARGDMARAVARTFSGRGSVNVTLGGAPALSVPVSPIASGILKRCS